MMFVRWRDQPLGRYLGVAAKLYWLAALSTLSVAILAAASIHFAQVTETAAARLSQRAFATVENSARLQSLLAQHRQIVESAPAEVVRSRLELSERGFIAKSSELSALLEKLNAEKSDDVADGLEGQITSEVPDLMKAGQQVMFYAYNFAQDKALEQAAIYGKIADDMEDKIHQYREHQIDVANSTVSALLGSARSLLFWVSTSAFAALMLIGPFGLTVMRGVLGRLKRITVYMSRLAKEPTAEAVPSRNDRDELGDMARAVQVFKDNGEELLERKMQLEQVNMQLDVALNNMAHGLCMFDAKRKLIICNGRYGAMYGLPEALCVPGTPLQSILQYLVERKAFAESAEETFAGGGPTPTENFHVIKPLTDGRMVAISHQNTADGGWVAIHEDITERQKAEAHIAHLARHDQLTDLPNRVFFREELEKSLRRLRHGEKFAVLCLDLDRFKSVNDSLGHSIGDKLLKAVASRLAGCIDERDFVARLGGDEFAIVQTNIGRPEDGSTLASRIIERLGAPYDIEGQQLDIGVSIGLAIAPADGKNADQLLKNADLAMYRAKADGRGSYCFFEPEMDARIQARRALELDLRSALGSGQLQLYYQPLVNAKTGEVHCFEALLRWFHPRLGAVPPGEFVPLAEESGLIGPLGQWVLRAACAEAAKWPSQFRVAVNLSPIQFKNLNLVKVILGALAASGLPAARLELEITESVLLEADPKTLAVLHELHALGIRIVMDDFGTGFSSLNYLRSFPFDKIKIDKSFVDDVSKGGDSIAIVRAIIDLARALKIEVVAEGVETADQRDHLVAEGCTEMQGFYFSRPAPIESFEQVLQERNGRIVQAA
ncbi:MAG TPA: EAL domain-containing protein [Xanthobacteraceae bacterium]